MDVIDAFVVTLGLDPSQYNREIKRYRDDQKRLREEQSKANKEQESAQKRQIDGMRSLRNEVAGFVFLLAGASGIKDFVSQLITGDAATGRLARNLGLATEQVSAWEGAVKRVGGTAADIDGALRSMSSAFQSLQLTGTTGHDADFQGLGVSAKDLQNPSDALLKIAEASQRMARPEFNARLGRLGFDQNSINLLAKGRVEVERMLEEQRKLGVVTDRDTEAAQRFQDQLAKIETALKAKLRPEIERMVGAFADWLEKGDNLNNLLAVTGVVLGGLAIAAAAAFWPFVLLAGAIAVVATNLDKLKSAWQSYNGWWEGVKNEFGMGGTGGAARSWYNTPIGASGGGGGGGGAPSAGGGGASSPWWGGKGGGASSPWWGGKGGDNSAQILSFFKSRGYTDAQARGITAGIVAESNGGDPNAFNRAGGGQGAFGLGQWRGDRLRALRAKYGNNPTMAQQLAFLDWELKGGDRGGANVLAARTARDALSAYVGGPGFGFMRPDMAGRLGDLRRGSSWLRSHGGEGPVTQTTNIGTINVNTRATDATGIARDIHGAIAKRGLVAQANTGLQP